MRLLQTFALFGSLILGSATLCSADDPSPGYDSPESAVRAYASAAAVEDYPRLFSALTRESQVYHLALAVTSAQAVHGNDRTMQMILDRNLPPLPVNILPVSEADQWFRLIQAMWMVKEPVRLMQDIAARHHELIRRGGPEAKPSIGDTASLPKADPPAAAQVELDRLEVRDDVAIAFVKLPSLDGVAAQPEEMAFRRVKGRWYCDIGPR
jgi:hypothetical protein